MFWQNFNARFVSFFGDYKWSVIALVILFGLYFLYKADKRATVFIVVSSLSYFYSVLIKLIFKHPRPQTGIYNTPLDIYSFPSSHVVVYTAFFGFLAFLLLTHKRVNKILKWFVVPTALYLVVFVGWSRIYLGVHFLADVIGGYIYGVFYLLTLIYLYIRKPRNKIVAKD